MGIWLAGVFREGRYIRELRVSRQVYNILQPGDVVRGLYPYMTFNQVKLECKFIINLLFIVDYVGLWTVGAAG